MIIKLLCYFHTLRTRKKLSCIDRRTSTRWPEGHYSRRCARLQRGGQTHLAQRLQRPNCYRKVYPQRIDRPDAPAIFHRCASPATLEQRARTVDGLPSNTRAFRSTQSIQTIRRTRLSKPLRRGGLSLRHAASHQFTKQSAFGTRAAMTHLPRISAQASAAKGHQTKRWSVDSGAPSQNGQVTWLGSPWRILRSAVHSR